MCYGKRNRHKGPLNICMLRIQYLFLVDYYCFFRISLVLQRSYTGHCFFSSHLMDLSPLKCLCLSSVIDTETVQWSGQYLPLGGGVTSRLCEIVTTALSLSVVEKK